MSSAAKLTQVYHRNIIPPIDASLQSWFDLFGNTVFSGSENANIEGSMNLDAGVDFSASIPRDDMSSAEPTNL